MSKIKYIAILASLCFSSCTMPNDVSSDTNKLIEEFRNSVSYMAGDKYCRTITIADSIEFEICEVPNENGNFIYNKKEILGKVKVKKGEILNIDDYFTPKENWILAVRCSRSIMPNSIWYSWYAPENHYNINEYHNSLFEQHVMIFDETLRDEVQGIEWTKGSNQFAYCENDTYISYHFKNTDLCLAYIKEKYSDKKVAKVSKNNPFG